MFGPLYMNPRSLIPEARTTDGSRKKKNWAKRYVRMINDFKRSVGKTHSHREEKARRVRQINKGILTKSNGLVMDMEIAHT